MYGYNQEGIEIGFRVSFDTHNGQPPWSIRLGSCGGTITTQHGLLTSPSYPENYPNDVECIYTILRPKNTYINITISSFDIICEDNLEMWDGDSQNSPKMASFCGNDGIIPPYLLTSQNNLRIR